jgi:uncharacterized membrane protein YbhN (UPF0104 family)
MIHSFFHFLARTLSAKNGDPSSTRLIFLGVAVSVCSVALAVTYVTVVDKKVPEIPGGTGAFLAALLAVLSVLKGVQSKGEGKEQ